MKFSLTCSSYSFLALLFLGTCGASAGNAASCTTLPPIDPNKDFVGNFNNPCYAVKMAAGSGKAQVGDLNAEYNQIYYTIQPGYSLIILGQFPNTRFMSATAYDSHLVIVGQLIDNQIIPLNSSMVNPLLPGATFVPNQAYGITVNLGAGSPLSITPGCATTGTTNIDQNVMDASHIHTGQSWNGDPRVPPGFPPHRTGLNTAGVLEVRKYVDISPATTAVVIVRKMDDGCAMTAADALANQVLAPTQVNPSPLLNLGQMQAHQTYSESILPKECYPPDPINKVPWKRLKEYIPIDNGADASVTAQVIPPYVQAMVAGTVFMRVQFKLPTHPSTPCLNGACLLTGNEDLRYKSLSLQNGQNTLISLKDTDFVTDADGNVTLLIGMGAVPPPQVTAANYYTFVDLRSNPNYAQLQSMMVRDIIPGPTFQCSGFNVPYKTRTFNPVGGFLGQYEMTVDFPTPQQLPALPIPPARTDSCAAIPPPPTVCPAFPPPTP